MQIVVTLCCLGNNNKTVYMCRTGAFSHLILIIFIIKKMLQINKGITHSN